MPLINHITVDVHADVREMFLETLLANAASTRKEEGCIMFEVSTKQEDENSFLFYEVFKDEAALDAHRQTAHFKKYFSMMQELGDKANRVAMHYTLLDSAFD